MSWSRYGSGQENFGERFIDEEDFFTVCAALLNGCIERASVERCSSYVEFVDQDRGVLQRIVTAFERWYFSYFLKRNDEAWKGVERILPGSRNFRLQNSHVQTRLIFF